MSSENLSLQTDRTLDARVKLYYDLYAVGDEPRPLLIALHGYGASKRQMMREARAIAPDDFAVASLQGFYQHIREPKEKGGPLRYGFGWLTSFRPEDSIEVHRRALLDLIDSLVNERVADSERIFLLGFSQSCALNYRFAFMQREVLRGVIGICGGLPGDWEASELYGQTRASVFHLTGERDEFYPPPRVLDYEERLRTRAREVKVESYDAGHEITAPMREDVRAWLAEHAQR
ncbi:MAG TPA: dienelactone hydrolase family protein [Pyrinomonadaceae bacterium]|nr:dienelactone hydrolase family protein [Pyrinomonadaceae bacterium]